MAADDLTILATLRDLDVAWRDVDEARDRFQAYLVCLHEQIAKHSRPAHEVILEIAADGVVQARRDLRAATRRLEHAIQTMRRDCVRILVGSGMSLSDVARATNISLQMARRLYHLPDSSPGEGRDVNT